MRIAVGVFLLFACGFGGGYAATQVLDDDQPAESAAAPATPPPVPPPPAPAPAPPERPAKLTSTRRDWVRLADDIATPWIALQHSDGNFPDFTDGLVPQLRTGGVGTRYGDSVLGLALMRHGLRTENREMIDSGIAAVSWATTRQRRDLQSREPSVFEIMAVAGAYNLARARMARNPHFRRARRSWVHFIRHAKGVSTLLHNPDTSRFSNHYLAEAIAVFELEKTGIRTDDPRYLVGPGFERAINLYEDMINVRIPELAESQGQELGGEETFLISDPPDYPLAYQGLALGFYAQALRMLGANAAPGAWGTLLSATNASSQLAAPDGDSAWFGRSMEESWALTGTALGATTAAERGEAAADAMARYRGLARVSLERLRGLHGPIENGYAIVPALHKHPLLGINALDAYAGSPSFTGLTLLQLGWMLDEMPRGRRPTTAPTAADRLATATFARGQSRVTVVRHGDTWFAVRAGQSLTRYPGDLRYDLGLVALKRGRTRKWHDVMPLRPLTFGERDSAGPVVYRDGERALPWTREVFVSEEGTVTLEGGFRTLDGDYLEGDVDFHYVPTSCGVRVTFEAQAGDRYEYSSFVRSLERRPRVRRGRVSDGVQRITASPRPSEVTVDPRAYHSASDPRLRRVRMYWDLAAPATISVTTCGR